MEMGADGATAQSNTQKIKTHVRTDRKTPTFTDFLTFPITVPLAAFFPLDIPGGSGHVCLSYTYIFAHSVISFVKM